MDSKRFSLTAYIYKTFPNPILGIFRVTGIFSLPNSLSIPGTFAPVSFGAAVLRTLASPRIGGL
ncbi:MAG TPA: hypothetical protein DEG17_05780 [Cyanobacteria bacterium UBA11149]|nr:hypothetical protein [Cyanobacteria bacterium UBA11366]HBK66895.1 hypothetical protein [Cyanobacteria bacterium UBA11166]HBR73458.1 hypothetical protein [Cyanobacteria bacterium UBA11159]HBS71882.1 hypothetical protein [Cyanobacteria bacterium UBA11153]HBW88388.1 hypothetical protein [Cyanobacteria bacterium UBA11149]HCA95491.1 hypothetical protein [Cyanobacteria bacterium UBA9226]